MEKTDGRGSRRVRIGLLGCGRISRLSHLANLGSNPAVELVAVADSRREALEAGAAHAPGARGFSDLHELLREAQPDAVVVALPTTAHAEAALASIEAGAHVYLEKPIAVSPAEAREIHRAWIATSLVGRIGFNARFNRLYNTLRERIARGDAGTPVAVRSSFTARIPSEATWRLSPATGGGALLELASHHIDLLRFIFETEIESVTATSWSNRGDDEAAMLQLTLANGVHAQMFVAYGTIEEDSIEVYGTEGKLRVNRYDSLAVELLPPLASGGLMSAAKRLRAEVGAVGYGLEKRRAPGQEPSFAASLGAFVTAVHDRKAAKPDFTDGLRAIEVVDAARRSISDSRPVVIG